ncbi:hypothetical protein PYCCODRAFT_548365 [Trametes coccinea BRFM310]|uniref:Uncharacterized protein n=1 Tax=Trametes coccinea (strain BRFM310) TaxID=1353009 RepID=A0A1Y2IIY5_TRAC3|nr:hypothetical protein PYCCODRAFT_548365 [Trametes coccinea BRFM310]
MSSHLDVPVEEDVLSDVVPSNIVSRQESEGVESEYDEGAADEMEVDELQSEGGEKVSAYSCMPASTCPAARANTTATALSFFKPT